MKPHRSQYWLNAEPEPGADEKIAAITALYCDAEALAASGERVLSTDEMTGIQAKERKHPTRPMGPGRVERREFEYIRHGTQTLIANWDVAAGAATMATSGRAVWDLRNRAGEEVASGLYFYAATSGTGAHTKGKFAIIK